MIIENGQRVKCFMRNSMVLEGIVDNWTAGEVVLKSIDGKNLMIVHHPLDDILVTKVVLEADEENSKEENHKESPLQPPHVDNKTPIKEKLAEVLQSSGDPELDKLNVQQLRTMVVEQEKQIISQKRKEHFGSVGNAKMTRYTSPRRIPFRESVPPSQRPAKIPKV
jgi:sRNA-binding regulator protein Hfq